jgi:hypothetical protein
MYQVPSVVKRALGRIKNIEAQGELIKLVVTILKIDINSTLVTTFDKIRVSLILFYPCLKQESKTAVALPFILTCRLATQGSRIFICFLCTQQEPVDLEIKNASLNQTHCLKTSQLLLSCG